MTRIECEYESDVLAAVSTGRWPDRVDADLRAHVAACEVCQDVAAVVAAFSSDIGDAVSLATGPAQTGTTRLPDASRVWLMAQVRARADATRLAARPITVAQAVAFASIVGALGALLGASSSWLQSGLRWVEGLAAQLDPRGLAVPSVVVTTMTEHALLVVAAGVCVMLAPVAVYLVMREN